MKQIIGFLMLTVLIGACGTNKTESSTTDSTDSTSVAITPVAMNQLSEQQKTDGWKLLFDGSSLAGWKIYKGKENDTWEVVDGTLHCKPVSETSAKRSDLITNDQYANFELSFDWKIPAGANSGVIYRATEEYDVAYASGPEYQIIDDLGYEGGVKKEANQTAANYDMEPATNKQMNPVGEWNTGKIMANGNHVEHWLNGVKVVEYEFGSDKWKQQVANSKWKDFPGYGLAKTGYIDLQDHGHEIWFRNVMVKTL